MNRIESSYNGTNPRASLLWVVHIGKIDIGSGVFGILINGYVI
jgi:hypothetical protein